ncbi:MAG: class I SAM-dependent methyltransferase [Alphaproteobacteria bacterium]|nr:class I SAM-dependent methyltransferase [Alphaproteobacteria bacterium]
MTDIENAENYKQRIKHTRQAAESYTRRKQSKHDAEMSLIRSALDHLDGVETFLDAPCGTGRATIMLTRLGYRTTGVDLGDAAVAVAKQKVKEAGVVADIEKADLEHLPYDEDSFDATLCFRLYHHFPNDQIRRRAISALCRVSKKYVLISYFSPLSPTSVRRRLRASLFNKNSRQVATSLSSIKDLFHEQDYHLVKNIPQRRFLNTLHLAVFKADG